jgi:tRNA1(Val) A37 N6-methylase TrmN6
MLTLILTVARLPDMLRAMDDRLGSVVILPLSARADRAPTRFLCRARKGGRAPFRMLAPCIMHGADRHLRDAEDYAPAIRAVLRDGAALDWRD